VEKNVAIRLYFQIGADTARNRALCRLFETIVYAPLFSELRTKQELGYIVGCSTTRTAGVIGFMVSVQAKAGFTPELLKERADTFLNSFTSSSETLLAAMGRQVPCTVGYDGNLFVTDVSFGIFSEAENQEFVKVRKSVIEKLLVAPKKQSELFERWTSQLAFHRLRFKDIAEEVNALEELTLDDLATFYTDYIHQKGTKCAKLCVKVPPYPTKEVEHEVQHKTAPATSEVKGDSKALLVPALASKKTEGDFETLSVATATREERQVMSKVTAMMSSRFFVGTAARPIVVIGGDIAEWRQQQMVHPQYAHFM
jgi:secreted Zn-dependent insulinase-like peptidase